MPRIRIEWIPVQTFGLGILGFDHLQLVYQQSDADIANGQDAWFVMEGVREEEGDEAFLGIEGADGRTMLSVANLAARDALVAKIGTPEYRGSRSLPYGGDEFRAWETMASYARDIERQDFPYIAYGLPGSPTPTINSSSAIASLIYYSGLDPSVRLPYGMHLSPGIDTRLGTSGDDAMRIECGFTTLLGGLGRDELVGGTSPLAIEKLYGGRGDDLVRWSAGFNIIHGGQPQLDYFEDGTDSIDYAGAGTVMISFNRHWIPHKAPTYVAVFASGRDHLYSIERIQWNETTDRIVLGNGLDLVEDDAILDPAAYSNVETIAGSHVRSARLIAYPDNTPVNRLMGDAGANILHGTAGNDTLYGDSGNDILMGGAGSDGYVYLPGDGDDVISDGGSAADIDELILAGGIAPAQVSLHRPAHAPDDLVLSFDGSGRLLIKDLLKGPATAIERIVFDAAPAWTRDDIQRRAAAAPVHEERDGAAAASTLDGGAGEDPGPAAAVDWASYLWLGLEAPAGWLF